MIAGRVNASDSNSTSGWRAADVGDQPAPERQRLGVRVVDAKGADTGLDPVEHGVAQRQPQSRLGTLGVEIDIDDILVLLRRVLGVADRAVGAPGEPLRMSCAARGDRASTESQNRAPPPCPCAAAAASRRRNAAMSPSCGCSAVCPPSSEPIAYGLPRSPGWAWTALLRPLRCVAVRWDGSAASTVRRNPWRESRAAVRCNRRRYRAGRAPGTASAGTTRTSWQTLPPGVRRR